MKEGMKYKRVHIERPFFSDYKVPKEHALSLISYTSLKFVDFFNPLIVLMSGFFLNDKIKDKFKEIRRKHEKVLDLRKKRQSFSGSYSQHRIALTSLKKN